jgi:hypothetical protein
MSVEKVSTQEQEETCPICRCGMNEDKHDCLTTKCGHKFHCSCLMTNTKRNGYLCPICRARTDIMDEVPTNIKMNPELLDKINRRGCYFEGDELPLDVLDKLLERNFEYDTMNSLASILRPPKTSSYLTNKRKEHFIF